MSVNTALYTVLMQQFDDLTAAVGRIKRRIMQETENLFRVCGSAELQRCLEPQQLALEDFFSLCGSAKSSSKGQPRVPHSAVFS